MTCTHPVANHVHGTHACYVLDRCRCDPCRTANRRYEQKRSRWAREFPLEDPPLIDADPARVIIDRLSDRGFGLKRIALDSGVAHGTLWKLVYGVPGRGPSKRVRRATLAKLVEYEEATRWDKVLADGARVPAQEARLVVAELRARGWTKAAIASHVAGEPRPALQAVAKSRPYVTSRTLRKLREALTLSTPDRIHSRTGKPFKPRGRGPREVPRLVEGVGGPVFFASGTAGERVLAVLEVEDGWVPEAELADRCDIRPKSVGNVMRRLTETHPVQKRVTDDLREWRI